MAKHFKRSSFYCIWQCASPRNSLRVRQTLVYPFYPSTPPDSVFCTFVCLISSQVRFRPDVLRTLLAKSASGTHAIERCDYFGRYRLGICESASLRTIRNFASIRRTYFRSTAMVSTMWPVLRIGLALYSFLEAPVGTIRQVDHLDVHLSSISLCMITFCCRGDKRSTLANNEDLVGYIN